MTLRARRVSFSSGLPWTIFACACALILQLDLAVAQVGCGPTTKGYFCEEDYSFSVTGRNMWGPGDEKPPDTTVKLFRDSWNDGISFSQTVGFRDFGTFGGSVNASSSGALGTYLGIGEFAGGKIDVVYDARMRLLGPNPDSFRPGQLVTIQFFGIPLLDSEITTSEQLTAGKFSLWGELDLKATAGGTGCLFGCTGLDLPGIDFTSLNSGEFPYPPGLPPLSATKQQLIFEIPANIRNLVVGPLWTNFTALYSGDCEDNQVEVEEFGDIYEKAGISGCLGFPQFPAAGGIDPDKRSLLIDEKVPFISLDLDLDFWASKIKGVPPLSWSKDFFNGLASVEVDGLDLDLNGTFSVQQKLQFKPRPAVTLEFAVPITYSIINYQNSTFVTAGTGTTVVLHWDEQMFFNAPDAQFNIRTTYSLPNTFSNDTDLVVDLGIVERILEGKFTLGSKLLGYEGFKICEPWPDYSCWRPGIWSPSVKFGVGPLKTVNYPLKDFKDSKILDNNQPPWSITGFQTHAGSDLPFNPAFLPTLVVKGAPSGPLPEGAQFTLDTTGSFDRDGDPITIEARVYDGFGPPFIQVPGPPLQADVQIDVTVPDNGNYRGFVVAYDLAPLESEKTTPYSSYYFPLTITNVEPSVSGVADGNGSEGYPFDLPVTVSDPGIWDTQLVTADWGDGTALDVINLPAGGGNASFSHVYADQGAYPVIICATDDDGGKTCENATATIANETPGITGFSYEQVLASNGSVLDVNLQLVATFSDRGTLDTHTARFVWDEDASEDPLAVAQSPFGPPGSTAGATGRISGAPSNSFSTSGAKTTQICIKDDENAESCAAGPEILIAGADLEINGSPDPATAPIGDILTLDYDVTNNGADAAPNVLVTIDLPTDTGGGQLTTLVSAKQGGAGGLEQKLLPADLAAQDPNYSFGQAIARAGDTLAISSAGVDALQGNQGAVYVFQKVAESWMQTAKLWSSDGETGDSFGSALAVSPDQSTIVVGASTADQSGVNSSEGAVYVYRRIDTNGTPQDLTDDDWIEEGTNLTSSTLADRAQLGVSVAIEGDTLVAGAFGDDEGVDNSAGSAIVFRRDDNGSPNVDDDDFWTEVARLNQASPQADALFGRYVAISAGRILVTSGDGDEVVGRITAFRDDGSGWAPFQTIDGAGLGGSAGTFAAGGLALQGDRLLVSSAGYGYDSHLHSFLFDGTAFAPDAELAMALSAGVALDGDYAVVGSYDSLPGPGGFEEIVGVARTLEWNGSAWVPEGVLLPAAAADRGDQFARNRVAVMGRSVIAATPLSPQIGQLGMGVAFVMQTCEQRPEGHIRCGLGTLGNGETRSVQIALRIGCALASGVDLVTHARVGAHAIDPAPADNFSDLTTSTSPTSGLCGYDGTPPLVSPQITGAEGANGWYVSNVDLDWLVSDPDSGIADSSGCGPSQVTGDTDGADFTCQATNGSYLVTRNTVSIRRDATPPGIVMNPNGTAGDNGWFTSDVVAEFVCSDSGSGIASCGPDRPVSGEGRHTGISGTAVDIAGNSASTSQAIDIDKTPPVITATRTTPNSAGWNNTDVTVEFHCTDALSGIASCTAPVVKSVQGAAQTADGLARDKAGLVTPLQVVDIRIDKTPPSVVPSSSPLPNGAGWNHETVIVSFSCSDALSGVAECPEPVVFGSEGAGQAAGAIAADNAGNENSVAAGPVNIDVTPPEISVTIAPPPDANGLRALPVTVSFGCSDSLSGIDICPAPVLISTPGLDQSVSVFATDLAGNSTELTVDDIDAGVPQLTLLVGDQSVHEGEFITGDLAQVSALALTEGVAHFDWGDGSTSAVDFTPNGADGIATTEHAFADNGDYTVTVTVYPRFGDPLTDTFAVSVDNLPPQFDSLDFGSAAATLTLTTASTMIHVDQPLILDFAYSDPGSADSHTALVDWGDGGEPEPVAPSESPIGPPSPGGMNGTLLASHFYAASGEYNGKACVTDDDGEQACASFAVTVDPAVAPPPLECSIVIGAPVVGASIEVPLESIVSGDDIADVSIQWEDAGNLLPFDDRTLRNPTLTFPTGGAGDHNVATSFSAQVSFANGQSNSCFATTCGIVSPAGVLSACALPSVVKQATVPTTVGGLEATVSLEGGGESCSFNGVAFVDPQTLSPPPPPELSFPLGALQFTLEECDVGSTVTVSVEVDPMPDFDAWFKEAGGLWIPYPTTRNGNIIGFELTDGGAGDADLAANGVIVDPGGPANVNGAPTQFHVTKDFSDGNPAEVTVHLECNTGTVLEQSYRLADGEHVRFVVTGFQPGTLDCTVSEIPLAGYSAGYKASPGHLAVVGGYADDAAGCHFSSVKTGTMNCAISNTLEEVTVTVNKQWTGDDPEADSVHDVEVSLYCSGHEGKVGSAWIRPGQPAEFGLFPDYSGEDCYVTEREMDGVVADIEDCGALHIAPGEGGECTVVNTRFYEGVPALGRYGLALLTLLMLGMGLFGWRRLA